MIKNLSKFTKAALLMGLLLIVYGYLSRVVGIYFFWESKTIGWFLLFIGIISLLADRVRIKSEKNVNSLPEKIGIGFIAFILLISTILLIIIPFTDAYTVAKTTLKGNQRLVNQVGKIHGFSFAATGAIQKTSDSNGTYGSATINITVKGEKKYKDLIVYVVKYADSTDWTVIGVE